MMAVKCGRGQAIWTEGAGPGLISKLLALCPCHAPMQAAVVSSVAFTLGAIIPLLAGAFIGDWE